MFSIWNINFINIHSHFMSSACSAAGYLPAISGGMIQLLTSCINSARDERWGCDLCGLDVCIAVIVVITVANSTKGHLEAEYSDAEHDKAVCR
jgi:hypothetical protein